MEMKSLTEYEFEASAGETMHELVPDGDETPVMLLRLAGLGAWSVLRDSGALRWDQRMHSLFGLEAGTFSGRQEDFINLIHQRDRDRVRRQFSDALNKGGPFATEYRVVWPSDGSMRVLCSKGLSREEDTGGACRMAGICWDVTESRVKEQEHAMERNLMRFLMDNAPDKIYFKDISGRFIRINKATRDWFGEDEDEGVIGKTDFGFFSEEHARQAFEDEHNVINTGVPIVHREEMETCRDGRKVWVSTTKMPLRDAVGRIIGTFGISLDITRQKRVEARLLEHLEKLLARNAELEMELKRVS